jgi:hypothetical protein
MENLIDRIILKLIACGYQRQDLEGLNPLELSELLVDENAKMAASEYEWKITRLGKLYYAQKYNKAA